MKNKTIHAIAYIIFILFAAIIILPMLWMIITGFKTNQELFLSPFKLPNSGIFRTILTPGIRGWESIFLTVSLLLL